MLPPFPMSLLYVLPNMASKIQSGVGKKTIARYHLRSRKVRYKRVEGAAPLQCRSHWLRHNMGRKVLLIVSCWLTLSQSFGDKRSYSLYVGDNESAESAPRLYRNVPLGVYASAAPYPAHTFHLPNFIAAPKAAASHVMPVNEHYVNHLTDSYGNQFVGTPLSSTYKLALPQQFVQLQSKLPEHLAQPLVAGSANFQFKQSNGQFFGAPYRVPVQQGHAPTPLHHFPTFGQLYGNNIKHLAPNTVIHSQAQGIQNTHQQPTNNKVVYTDTQSHERYNHYKEEPKVLQQKEPQIIVGKPKVQGIQEVSNEPYGNVIYEKTQAGSYSTHKNPKKEAHAKNADAKYQRLKESSSSDHQAPNHSHEQVNSEFIQGLPHYETKYQIIQDQPHSSQFQRIKEHQPLHGEVKFQRIQDASSNAHNQHNDRVQNKPEAQSNKAKLQAAPAKQVITYINDINGEKTIVELETTPSLPLLDLTLLEPLTFDNPLVPQVQHFLPRINQATYQKLPEINKPMVKNYQKEFVIQKTSSYDSSEEQEKPQKDASRKKHKKPTQPTKHAKKNEVPRKTTVTYHEHLEDVPEVIHEINSPNYKEIVKEKSVSYNMKTHSEPVHHTYGSKIENEPVTYSYSRTSKEPVQSVQYSGNGPSHLAYDFKSKEHAHEETPATTPPHRTTAHDSKARDDEDSHESAEDTPSNNKHHGYTKQYEKHSESSEEHHEPVHNEKENYHKQNEQQHDPPSKHSSEPFQIISEDINFQPILREYEENIRSLAPSASIKVDPHQHVQPKSTPQPVENHYEEPLRHHHPHSSPSPPEHAHSSHNYQETQHHAPPSDYYEYNGPTSHIHEKSKRVIIQEKAPNEMHMLREQMRQEVVDREENSEDNFEKAYEEAALGFPAYNKKTSDSEKDIFDPESYGVPRDHVEYDFEHTPLQQYQAEGDEFPTEARALYKDARDKMKQNYYTDFSVSKPEGMLDRYQNKLNYYKLFKEQKPDYVVDYEQADKKQKHKSAKYIAAPSYDFQPSQDKSESYYGQPKQTQQLHEYNYSQKTPGDNSAFASRPYQNYKSRTSFVEPQFQYGFEPLLLPKLLDSELAAMASNDSPESKDPGTVKKMYKENWYINTRTTAGAPAS
ncbi:unnamed protein product [Arctia plantaginis]|uniref:Uncharacterized protein n=1 Tax=Arctia plantaginis TaxID=874455 RepID=A0A8S1A1N9_ARCPL|nr:unnamed protein product [Arctia plantaginis]